MRCAGDGGEERQLLSGRAPRSYTDSDSLIPPAALTRGGRRSEVAAGRSGCSRTRLSQPFPAAGSGGSVRRVASSLLVPQRGQGHGAFLGSECRAAGRRGSRFVWGLAHRRGRGTVKLAVARSLTPLPLGPSAQRASVRGDTGRPPCAVAVGLDAGVPPPPASNRVTCPGQQPGSRGAATLAVLSTRPVPGDLHAAAARDLRPAFRPSSLPRRPRWVGGQGGGGPCRAVSFWEGRVSGPSARAQGPRRLI